MNRPRFVAALVVVVALVSLVVFALQVEEEPPARVFAAELLITTTTEPDFEALVQSGVISILPPQEQELTREALSRSTSTTTTTIATTTTTLPPSTTTTTGTAASETSPPATSPPTTAPTTTSPPTTAAQGGFVAGAESDFAASINSLRGSNGLGALQRSGSLDSYARDWARHMGQNGSLDHSNVGSLLGPWGAVGENIGVGGSVSGIFDALVGSSGHYNNMVGDWTHMGVGVWRDAQGALWTCHVFAR